MDSVEEASHYQVLRFVILASFDHSTNGVKVPFCYQLAQELSIIYLFVYCSLDVLIKSSSEESILELASFTRHITWQYIDVLEEWYFIEDRQHSAEAPHETLSILTLLKT